MSLHSRENYCGAQLLVDSRDIPTTTNNIVVPMNDSLVAYAKVASTEHIDNFDIRVSEEERSILRE